MSLYQAAWVVPVAGPPLREGWVRTRDGVVIAAGDARSLPTGEPAEAWPGSAILPGLVNAHTHLELSWLRGRVGPASSFIDWLSSMMSVRLGAPETTDPAAQREAMRRATLEMRASGTAVVGDISNSLIGFDILGTSGLVGVVFHELLGFAADDGAAVVTKARARVAAAGCPAGWRVTLAPHAPYSVSPALFRAIREATEHGCTAVHVAESADEVEFIATGQGRWRATLQSLGAWCDTWQAPGTSPVAYLDALGFWQGGGLAVHAVQAGDADLACLGERGVTVVTCPRSNAFVGSGAPPLERFYASGVRVAIGTDSLSSVEDLNLFHELAEMRRLAPTVPACKLLRSATLSGAEALGFAPAFGAIVPGASASVLAVDVPPGTDDVEEYLVSGIDAAQVRWLSEAAGGPAPC